MVLHSISQQKCSNKFMSNEMSSKFQTWPKREQKIASDQFAGDNMAAVCSSQSRMGKYNQLSDGYMCCISLAFVLSSGSCQIASDFGSYIYCINNRPTSCWCWMEMQGRHGCLMDDPWDWEDPSEAPQESPRFDTIPYSPSPFGDQHGSIPGKQLFCCNLK